MKTLSSKAKYGLRAVYALARSAGEPPVLIADLAERERIPRKFLEAILLELRNAGILHSRKGKGGGYSLARSPDAITVGQVLRIIDGPLAPAPCVSEKAFGACEECVSIETCGTRLVMKEVRDSIAKILDTTTLAAVIGRLHLVERERKHDVAYSI